MAWRLAPGLTKPVAQGSRQIPCRKRGTTCRWSRRSGPPPRAPRRRRRGAWPASSARCSTTSGCCTAPADFFVLGATGNVYTVTLATTPACTCPDPGAPCKHILFVLLRVLGLSLDEACVWRQSLRPCQVARLVAAPTRGRKAADQRRQEAAAPSSERLDGAACPVCLEEMAPSAEAQGGAAATVRAPLLTCGTCRNSVHAECFARWKRSRARRAATCVVCRARWRKPSRDREQDQQQYMNLSAYMNEENDAVDMQVEDGALCAG
ncbi:hypothetical protein ZWY2020_001939 [Hordeum vulgare]|nr:hypothetical protein ZWY2020_001939 [Hordeum vulgare]